jgi:IS1 family transposase
MPGDVTEIDELCVRFSDNLWLWLAVSRKVKTVLGFVLSDRSDTSLERLMNEEVPPVFWGMPSCSDGWGAYRRLLPQNLHTICDKGSGKTSIVEGLNTKWRQRQSGLVRKSCGVCRRIVDDLFERFLILVYRHNLQCLVALKKNNATT